MLNLSGKGVKKLISTKINNVIPKNVINNQKRSYATPLQMPTKGRESLQDTIFGQDLEAGLPLNENLSVARLSKGHSRMLQINRPRESNRMTSEVARDLLYQLKVLNNNPMVKLLIFSGVGKGFLSAGYDTRELKHLLENNEVEKLYTFLRNTYKLSYYVTTCETPTLGVISGAMIGPGVALGAFANYSVATPGSIFACPEVSYGYFPDCGTTFLLSNMNKKYPGLGTFIGLTGTQIHSSDLVHCGVANYFSIETLGTYIMERVGQVATGLNREELHDCIIENVEGTIPPLSFGFELFKIKKHFDGKNSVEEIIESLHKTVKSAKATLPEREWADRILTNFSYMSPLSLKITFRAIKENENLSLEQIFQRDYRITTRLIHKQDFSEGIKALLEGTEPKWQYETLGEVTDSVLDDLFKPLTLENDKDCDLTLPGEPFNEDQVLRTIKKNKNIVVVTKQ
ncbi:hypothetical protein ABK040_009162 [Willaertia magna]